MGTQACGKWIHDPLACGDTWGRQCNNCVAFPCVVSRIVAKGVYEWPAGLVAEMRNTPAIGHYGAIVSPAHPGPGTSAAPLAASRAGPPAFTYQQLQVARAARAAAHGYDPEAAVAQTLAGAGGNQAAAPAGSGVRPPTAGRAAEARSPNHGRTAPVAESQETTPEAAGVRPLASPQTAEATRGLVSPAATTVSCGGTPGAEAGLATVVPSPTAAAAPPGLGVSLRPQRRFEFVSAGADASLNVSFGAALAAQEDQDVEMPLAPSGGLMYGGGGARSPTHNPYAGA